MLVPRYSTGWSVAKLFLVSVYCGYTTWPPCDLCCGYMICPPCDLYCGSMICPPCDLYCGHTICPPCDLCCGYMICLPCDLYCGSMICPPYYLNWGYTRSAPCDLYGGYMICPPCDLCYGYMTCPPCDLCCGYMICVTWPVPDPPHRWVCDPSRHRFVETFTSVAFTSLSNYLPIMMSPTTIKLVLSCLWYRNASVSANMFSDCRNLIALKPINSRWIVATKCASNETVLSR